MSASSPRLAFPAAITSPLRAYTYFLPLPFVTYFSSGILSLYLPNRGLLLKSSTWYSLQLSIHSPFIFCPFEYISTVFAFYIWITLQLFPFLSPVLHCLLLFLDCTYFFWIFIILTLGFISYLSINYTYCAHYAVI